MKAGSRPSFLRRALFNKSEYSSTDLGVFGCAWVEGRMRVKNNVMSMLQPYHRVNANPKKSDTVCISRLEVEEVDPFSASGGVPAP